MMIALTFMVGVILAADGKKAPAPKTETADIDQRLEAGGWPRACPGFPERFSDPACMSVNLIPSKSGGPGIHIEL
jgi:hypothetical protein